MSLHNQSDFQCVFYLFSDPFKFFSCPFAKGYYHAKVKMQDPGNVLCSTDDQSTVTILGSMMTFATCVNGSIYGKRKGFLSRVSVLVVVVGIKVLSGTFFPMVRKIGSCQESAC